MKAFLRRPIEGDWPYLWINATYVKVRESGSIISVAVIAVVGINGGQAIAEYQKALAQCEIWEQAASGN